MTMNQPDDWAMYDHGAAPFSHIEEDGEELYLNQDDARGDITLNAPLAKLVWFKSGGAADYLFEPEDTDDLRSLMSLVAGQMPVMALGLGSNLIIRDGGVPGVVVRLGKPFSYANAEGDEGEVALTLNCGGGTPGILVASAARDAGIAGLEFLRGIPGTVGGFVRMNGGAYGCEVADILIDCEVVMPDGTLTRLPVEDLGYSYRHSALPEGAVVVSARFRGEPGEPEAIGAEMDRIAKAREDSQPLRTKTGGSTFKNPPNMKAWQLVDEAGCRGLMNGDAMVSEKHTNFLINTGDASSAEIEGLGEDVRARVYAKSGIELEWEIQRVGRV